ncbi:hypothetical protein [Flavobacterium sp. ASW18X]|uniref:hypothetical protein n=1 Tax=Flavobacterium sp. ASW18X TaxID=2572595 RepID=UPI0010AE7FE8|nr:hypothetical protein [Flavobacterium sp. ASW18X]TKD60537.1 hypothetical protein FBT53_13110 [Flavobacterium sp. ASW18X]
MGTIEKFRKNLLENYKPMLDKIAKSKYKESSCVFCAQWGETFLDVSEEAKVFFVGRAVNGWIHNIIDSEIIFGSSDDRLFNRPDQLKWVVTSYGKTNGYNPKKSAFWRVVKRVAIEMQAIHDSNWHKKIAWSNLFKVAPNQTGGNPNIKLRNIQREYCISIFKKELEFFNPEIIVMFTGGWEGYFLKNLMGIDRMENLPEPKKVIGWGDKYESSVFEIDCFGEKRKFIVSQHPMGKKEFPHVEAILKLMWY